MICRRLCGTLRGQQRSLWLEAAAGSSLVTAAAARLIARCVKEVAARVALVEDAEQRYCALHTALSSVLAVAHCSYALLSLLTAHVLYNT